MYFSRNYNRFIAQNLLLATVTDINDGSYVDNRLFSVGIENTVPIQSQFIYLFILTQSKPYMARKYPSKKRTYRFAPRADTAKIAAFPARVRYGYLMHKLYHEFSVKQFSPEFASIKLTENFTKIIT